MSEVTLTISPDYGYVLLSAMAICFHCQLVSGKNKRYKIMDKKFIEENLKEENEKYRKVFGADIPRGAYPDMGDGRHAAKLPYEKWVEFACAQRAHQNYVEGLPTALVYTLISGLFFPRATAILAVFYMINRELYCSSYRNAGAAARLRGVGYYISLIAMLVMSIYGCLQMTGVIPK